MQESGDGDGVFSAGGEKRCEDLGRDVDGLDARLVGQREVDGDGVPDGLLGGLEERGAEVSPEGAHGIADGEGEVDDLLLGFGERRWRLWKGEDLLWLGWDLLALVSGRCEEHLVKAAATGSVHEGVMERKEDVFLPVELLNDMGIVAAGPQDGDSPGRSHSQVLELLVMFPALMLGDFVLVLLDGLAGHGNDGDLAAQIDGGDVDEVGVACVVPCDANTQHGLVLDDGCESGQEVRADGCVAVGAKGWRMRVAA